MKTIICLLAAVLSVVLALMIALGIIYVLNKL